MKIMTEYVDPIPLEPISGWGFTAARQTVGCSKCKVEVGYVCRTPKGRRAQYPHPERMRAYTEAVGDAEFRRRHMVIQ